MTTRAASIELFNVAAASITQRAQLCFFRGGKFYDLACYVDDTNRKITYRIAGQIATASEVNEAAKFRGTKRATSF